MIVASAVLLGLAAALLNAPVDGRCRPARAWSIPTRPIAAGLGLYLAIGGTWGLALGLAAAVALARRSSDSAGRADASWGGAAPVVVALIAAAIRAGVPAPRAVGIAAATLDPAHAGGLVLVTERWRYGLSALEVDLDRPSRLIAQTIEHAQDSGAAPALALEHAVEDLTGEAALRAQEQARRVGVRAALPLGVCLLPAFLCLGVAPLVAALVSGLAR